MLKLVDGKTFRLSDLDTDIKASTNSTESGSQNIAAITRNEFVEAMIRIALDKYYRTQICKTEGEAVEKLVFENLIPAVPMLESDKWRYARYLNEECDLILSQYDPYLQHSYTKYSSSTGGDKAWMSLDQFISFCAELGLINKSFGVRQYALCYQLSLVMGADARKTPQMSYVEFLEALARVVDYLDVAEAEKAIFNCVWDATPLDQKLNTVLTALIQLQRSPSQRKTQITLGEVKAGSASGLTPRVPSNN